MILFTIIGAIIGAGFASGQEIYLFFYRFGINGIYGIIICNIIMTFIIYKTLKIVHEKNINTYKEFLNTIFKENIVLANIMNIIINIFLCVTFFIMLSGFGAYISQRLNINPIIGSSILSVICYIVFLKNIESLTKINSIIIPILIFVILIIGLKNSLNINYKEISNEKGIFWCVQAILYVSYNLILVEPVIVSLKDFIKNKKQIKITSIITGIIMTILSIMEFLLLANIENFKGLEMPIVNVIENKYQNFSKIYGIIILIAIFTTAVSVGIGFLNNICKNKKSFPQIGAILCISGVIISPIGFSNLVANLFPLFGFLGLIQIIYIFKSKY